MCQGALNKLSNIYIYIHTTKMSEESHIPDSGYL